MTHPVDRALDSVLVDHSSEILLLVDRATLAVRAANGGALRRLGYTRDTLIGRPITDFECALADIFYWDEVRQGEAVELVDTEATYLCADGSLLDAVKSVARVPEHPGCLIVCALPTGKLRQAEEELAVMSARLRATLEATADGILLVDRSGAILNMNQRFARLWLIPPELLVGHDDQAIQDYLAGCMTDPAAYRSRLHEISPDSDDETFDLLHLADGRSLERKSRPARQRRLVIGRVFSFTDVTERRRLETRLKLAASVFTHAHEGIMITDAQANIIDVNETFEQITGYARNDVIDSNARILSSGRQQPEFYAAMWQELDARGHWHGELWNRRKNGELFAEKLSIAAVRDGEGVTRHFVALFSDITSFKEHQRQLEHMAHYDALTGIPNRVLLADRLRQAIAQTRRRQRLMAVAYLDLDGFKNINDTHGHEIGDQLLIALARRLNNVLREGDTLARLGGDEFVAVLTDLGNRTECEAVLERLLKAAATPIHVDGRTLQLSASLGVTLYPQDGSDPDTLLRHADQAMYQAKEAGKNRYHLFDPEHDRLTQSHRESIQCIAQALETQQFILHYQPKVNMRTGEVIGVEALLRWQHPQRGLLLPGEFLPLIEGNELIARIGDWVLETALAQISAWCRDGLDMTVGVNIAALHLQQEGFQARLEKLLAAHPNVPADRLELEVLETAALEGVVHVSQVIEACQGLGVSFSLDDFGTGYSSLTYLKRLPTTLLKIDRSFVHDMLWDAEDLAIVEGVIGLATAFRRAVIAEGVETAAHGELLLRLGCELAQGYGIARPMPPEQLPEWVRSWQLQPQWARHHEAPLHRDDLPLAYAEVELRSWIRGLEAYCDGSALTLSSKCERSRAHLYDWLEGNGRQRYGNQPGFAGLCALNAQIQGLASDVATARAVNDIGNACRLLRELHAVRDKLIDQLYALAAGQDGIAR